MPLLVLFTPHLIESSFVIILPFDTFTFLPLSISEVVLSFDTNLYSLDIEGVSGVTGTSGVSPPATCQSPHISSINPGASMNGFLLP